MDAANGDGAASATEVRAVLEEAVEVLEEAEALLEEIEIEAYAHTGERKPKARVYVFRVGKERFKTTKPVLTGAEILTIAGKTPPEKYILRQVLHGGQLKKIELDEKVDLRAPGVERFRAMPRTAQDG